MGVELANNHVPFYNFDETLSYDFWYQLPCDNEPIKGNVHYIKRLVTLREQVLIQNFHTPLQKTKYFFPLQIFYATFVILTEKSGFR